MYIIFCLICSVWPFLEKLYALKFLNISLSEKNDFHFMNWITLHEIDNLIKLMQYIHYILLYNMSY